MSNLSADDLKKLIDECIKKQNDYPPDHSQWLRIEEQIVDLKNRIVSIKQRGEPYAKNRAI